MKYINTADFDYIMNKYHDQNQVIDSFDSVHRGAHIFNRFIRNDKIFDDSTGLCADDIVRGIWEQDKELEKLPHPVRKARAFEYVLKNTRISCDSRDRFPSINMIDRPLNNTLINKWKAEVFQDIIPDTEKKRAWFEDAGIVTIWPDYDHSVPVWERIFELGFKGLLDDSERMRKSQQHTDEEDAFFEGIRITYTAIIEFLYRLAALAEETEGSGRLGKALKNIAANPPSNFYEMLLVDYIYFMLSEHIEGLQVRSLSNFDRVFFSAYMNDLKNGISSDEICSDLAYFLLQFQAIGNYWGQPVFLGGCKENEETEINELSYLFLDVFDYLNIYNVKIQIKVADSTPKEFLLKALDMIRRGNNSIVFVSDATIRKALENTGVSKNEARLCDVKGCYEYSARGSMDVGMNYLNLMKPLEYALHEGCDGISGEFALRKSPALEEYDTFDKLYEEYKNQVKCLVDSIIEVADIIDDYLAYMNPQSMLSATLPAALKKGRDALAGGGDGNGNCVSIGFLADIADSLTAIKKYVYDKKEITLQELVKMLDTDFEGNELFRRKLLTDPDKYGNNRELPDSFAVDIVDFTTKYIAGRPITETRDGYWCNGYHVARMSYSQSGLTATSPNGRLRGEELSKNCSASMGQNREGATAAILSATKIDATSFKGDACLDLGLLPSAVSGDDGLQAMYGLLMTFVKRGGHAMHINVFDAETLRKAQEQPEKYRDLQIRVCGWNVLWNDITKVEQDGFIKQAESLV